MKLPCTFAGFYGDALATPKGDCKPCQCYSLGTVETQDGPPVCDQLTGQCQCKPHVVGTNCDQCEAGFYNIGSGTVCKSKYLKYTLRVQKLYGRAS